MTQKMDFKPHFYLGRNGNAERYTAPATGGGGSKIDVPQQDRRTHGAALEQQLNQVKSDQELIKKEASNYKLEAPIGIQVVFDSFPGVEMAVESLADANKGVELLNVVVRENKVYATIFVPEGKLSFIENKLRDYLAEKKNKKGIPIDNRKLIDAIEVFKKAGLKALWTDDENLYPQDENEIIWWEVWLPVRGDRQRPIHDFKMIANEIGIIVSDRSLEFPENSVLMARGSINNFSQSSLLLNNISELRKAKETAAFFDESSILEQREWMDNLLSRLDVVSSEKCAHVCILDTGVNIGHPLLEPFIDETSQYTINPEWLGNDDDGHGTNMAGIAAWGDLTLPLSNNESVKIKHRIESVKLLREPGHNQGENLGLITSDGVSAPETKAPEKNRVFTMALSSKDARDRGRPSSWSAAIDGLSSDYLGENENRKLFLLCAGNVDGDLTDMKEYPEYNLLQDIHDPGQSWNALTVGAHTFKVHINDEDASNYSPLAPLGGLSPFSSTSTTWDKSMPIKPEVVFEGGNTGVDSISCASLPSLSLLTTDNEITTRLFSTFNATSAATAMAGRFAAEILSHNPNFWPETIRALIVHSAEWTKVMCDQFAKGNTPRQRAQYRVRCVGYGVPNIDRALWSIKNSLSLIIEDQLQPFQKEKTKGITTRDMNLHDLPWPKDQLLALGDVEVKMSVTLSYFIEPNPSSRSVKTKYSYPSFGLKFDVKRPLESIDEFRKRINRQARDKEEGTTSTSNDPNWMLGDFRHKGSIHKDVWTGKAAELAERGQLAIYPTIGWWRTRTKLERFDKSARYALIISIDVPGVDTDIYAEVESKIAVTQAVHV